MMAWARGSFHARQAHQNIQAGGVDVDQAGQVRPAGQRQIIGDLLQQLLADHRRTGIAGTNLAARLVSTRRRVAPASGVSIAAALVRILRRDGKEIVQALQLVLAPVGNNRPGNRLGDSRNRGKRGFVSRLRVDAVLAGGVHILVRVRHREQGGPAGTGSQGRRPGAGRAGVGRVLVAIEKAVLIMVVAQQEFGRDPAHHEQFPHRLERAVARLIRAAGGTCNNPNWLRPRPPCSAWRRSAR